MTNIMEDFIKAQKEMENAGLNKTNPHFKSRYADLSAVREATLAALNNNGLGIIQTPTIKEDGSFVLISKIIHKSGEVVQQSEYPLSNDIPPQKMGSEITYARRYTWSSLCGICAEEDDDGNTSQKPAKSEPDRPPFDEKTVLKASILAAAKGMEEYTKYFKGLCREAQAFLSGHPQHTTNKAEAALMAEKNDPFGLPPVDAPTEAEQAAE